MMLDPITMHRLTQDIYSERVKSFEDARRMTMMSSEPRFPRLDAAVRGLRARFRRPAGVQPVAARRTTTQEVACVHC